MRTIRVRLQQVTLGRVEDGIFHDLIALRVVLTQ